MVSFMQTPDRSEDQVWSSEKKPKTNYERNSALLPLQSIFKYEKLQQLDFSGIYYVSCIWCLFSA